MSRELRVIRADDLKAMIEEYDISSWNELSESILQVLEEVIGVEALATMPWQELIRHGYRMGIGHLILSLLSGELKLELLTKGKAYAKLKAITDQIDGVKEKK